MRKLIWIIRVYFIFIRSYGKPRLSWECAKDLAEPYFYIGLSPKDAVREI